MGYAQQMMEEAKRWLAVNPDPNAVLWRPPLVSDEWIDKVARKVEEAERLAPGWAASQQGREMLEDAREMIERRQDRERELGGLINSLLQPCTAAMDRSNYDDYMMVGHWLIKWATSGFNTFDLSADFVAAMLLTDPRDLRLDRLRLPFPGLLLTLPDRFVSDGDGRQYTKIHVCEVSRPAVDEENGERVLADRPAGRLIDIRAPSKTRWLITTIDHEALTERGVCAMHDREIANVGTGDEVALDSLQRVVLGTLAYVTSVERALVQREPRRRRKGDAPDPKIWDVGRTVSIDPRLVQVARAGSREVALRLRHRHIVRGHYRNQPVGERRKERKTIWIAPFWKGPEDGAAIVHTYKPAAP